MGFPKYPFFKLLALYLFFISVNSTVDPISEALLSLKSELIHDSKSLNDWFIPLGENPSQKIQACSWSGVKCDKNSTTVIGLDLSMKNLGGTLSGKQFSFLIDLLDFNISHNSFSGKLPVGIFNLSNLTSLDISRNNFSGTFPGGISNLQHLVVLDSFSNSFSGSLPTDVSEIYSLKVLNFAGSYFNGSIPAQYGSFQRLEFIHLAGNYLTGNLPPELGRLKTVSHMEIGYNTYQGSIPWQFGNMSELQYLDIAGANLSGSIPTQLSNLTKLHTLFLFRNQLSGLIPIEFSQISTLENFDLSDNLLSGPIPESFSELKNLKLLSLMYNEMDGPVPEGIAKLPNLDTLLIWSNFFSGSLPKDLGKYSKLKWVDVSTNNLVGVIPPDICSGGVLFKLILFSNNFSGGLFPSLSNCSSLVRLRIEDNSFSGEIPLNFSSLPDISYADMSRNRFTGGIPHDIFHAPNLQYFNVSNNLNLGGVIPEKAWSLPAIQNFSAFSCNISGSIPRFQLCKSLSVLELHQNHLSGIFPESVSNCESLEEINLAENHLTGQIPMKLGNLTSLKIFNISFNDFSGLIPSEKVFRSMESSSFFGNPKLCGAPLRPCHHGKGLPEGMEWGSRRTQKLAWVLILCAVVVLLITVSVFGILYFQKRKGKWKMVSFSGLPQFTANDVLRSFNPNEAIELESVPSQSSSVCKAVLPTGITVLVKKIEWKTKQMNDMIEFINQIGHARHKNLVRLLGFCYNKDIAYLLYDYLPNGSLGEKIEVERDWADKCRIMSGIARGLCFLHHDCYPAIPHGDLKTSNIVFDENMEPHLAEYGFKALSQLKYDPPTSTISRMESGELNASVEKELYADIFNFGGLVLEILTNGRLKHVEGSIDSKPMEVLLGDIYDENEVASSSSKSFQEEIKLVLEVALLCTSSRITDRPSMKDVLKLLLSGLKPQST